MKNRAIAVLLLLALLLTSCAVPLKETGTAEEKTEPVPGTEAGARESVPAPAAAEPETTAAEPETTAAEPETTAAEPEPAAEDPERIAVIRTVQTTVLAASSTSSSGGQTVTITSETYLAANGLPARVVSVQTMYYASQAPEEAVVAAENEVFFFYHFDESGRLDQIRAKNLPGDIGLEWEEDGGRVSLFFLYEGEKRTTLVSGTIAAAGNILQLLQHYTAFADAELVFEGTNSLIRLKDGRIVFQRIQQDENTWTETEEEEADGDGITRIRTVTHMGTEEYVQIMEYDREQRLIRITSEDGGRRASMTLRYESLTEDGKRIDRGYMDELETEDEEVLAEMAGYEGAVLTSYQFDEQGRLSSFTMYENDLPYESTCFDEEGRIIRQENFFGFESSYVTETEYRKASEITEIFKQLVY